MTLRVCIVFCVFFATLTINGVKTDQSEIPPDIMVHNDDAKETVVISDVANIEKDVVLSDDHDFVDVDDEDVETEASHAVETVAVESDLSVVKEPETIQTVAVANAKSDKIDIDTNAESVPKSRAGKSRSGNYYQYDDFVGGLDFNVLGGDSSYDYGKFFYYLFG